MKNPKELVQKELVGLNIEVIGSKNKSNVGITGKVVDETKNTLLIEQKNKKKRLFKKNITINIKFKNKTLNVQGDKLFGKPKERIKK